MRQTPRIKYQTVNFKTHTIQDQETSQATTETYQTKELGNQDVEQET